MASLTVELLIKTLQIEKKTGLLTEWLLSFQLDSVLFNLERSSARGISKIKNTDQLKQVLDSCLDMMSQELINGVTDQGPDSQKFLTQT